MELLTRPDALALMMDLRRRQSTLCKLRAARQQDWYAQHPEVQSRILRLYKLQDELELGCVQSNTCEEILTTEIRRICDELSQLPKCPDGLTPEEEQELRDAMSQAERLRRGLEGTRRAAGSQ